MMVKKEESSEYVVFVKERMLKDLSMHSKVFGESNCLKVWSSSYYLREYTREELEIGFKALIMEGSLVVVFDSIVPWLVRYGLSNEVYSYYEDEYLYDGIGGLKAIYTNIEHLILMDLTMGNRNYKTNHKKLLKTIGCTLVDLINVLDDLECRGLIEVTKKKKIKLSDDYKEYIKRLAIVETEFHDAHRGLEIFLSNIRGQVNSLNIEVDQEEPDYDFELDYDEELELMENLDLLDAAEEDEEEELSELERYEALEDYIFPEISRNLYWYVKNKRCVK